MIDVKLTATVQRDSHYVQFSLKRLDFAISPCSSILLRELDSNQRPLGYEPNELPTAPPRDMIVLLIADIFTI